MTMEQFLYQKMLKLEEENGLLYNSGILIDRKGEIVGKCHKCHLTMAEYEKGLTPGKEIKVFGDSHIEEIAEKFGYDLLAKIPMDPEVASYVDKGWIETIKTNYLEEAANIIEAKCNK